MKERLPELEKIMSKISAVYSELKKLLDKISKAQTSKEKAEEQYNLCLDKGDEKGMSKSLKIIRESNSEVETLKKQLTEYPGKVQELYDQQKTLMTSVRSQRPEREKAIEAAKAELQNLEQRIGQCTSLMSNINDLSRLVSENA